MANKEHKSWKHFKLGVILLLIVTVIAYYLLELSWAKSIIEVSVGFILIANIFMLSDLIGKMKLNKRIQESLEITCVIMFVSILISSFFLY
ncbi:hypothetical protein [Listeria marthii]|uniref:hypothetical protein n=1 Tax=Listeria marthii TaxID=529731 RepID=UPI0016285140|nr:hypothetical protein [Listeria marthii]MBC2011993.1 hypothetical protein [Listeria marthii]MBC2062943.1 hypothetical protein [Listeria marthii]